MTAVITGRAPLRLSAGPPPLNWEKVGVIVAILTQLGGAVWFAASVDRRVAAIEAQLPAGIIAKLDQHMVDLDRSLSRLEAAR